MKIMFLSRLNLNYLLKRKDYLLFLCFKEAKCEFVSELMKRVF